MLAASFVTGKPTFLFAVLNGNLQVKATAIIASDQQMEIEFRREGGYPTIVYDFIFQKLIIDVKKNKDGINVNNKLNNSTTKTLTGFYFFKCFK